MQAIFGISETFCKDIKMNTIEMVVLEWQAKNSFLACRQWHSTNFNIDIEMLWQIICINSKIAIAMHSSEFCFTTMIITLNSSCQMKALEQLHICIF